MNDFASRLADVEQSKYTVQSRTWSAVPQQNLVFMYLSIFFFYRLVFFFLFHFFFVFTLSFKGIFFLCIQIYKFSKCNRAENNVCLTYQWAMRWSLRITSLTGELGRQATFLIHATQSWGGGFNERLKKGFRGFKLMAYSNIFVYTVYW